MSRRLRNNITRVRLVVWALIDIIRFASADYDCDKAVDCEAVANATLRNRRPPDTSC